MWSYLINAGAVLPFGAVFIELFFIMSSVRILKRLPMHTHLHTHTHMHTRTRTRTRSRSHTRMRTHKRTRTHVYLHVQVWLQRFYYVFGFLAIVLLILFVTCAEISIVLCYFQLCNEARAHAHCIGVIAAHTRSRSCSIFFQLCKAQLSQSRRGCRVRTT